jgi:hypothetical protein
LAWSLPPTCKRHENLTRSQVAFDIHAMIGVKPRRIVRFAYFWLLEPAMPSLTPQKDGDVAGLRRNYVALGRRSGVGRTPVRIERVCLFKHPGRNGLR